MALVLCPECQGKVSTESVICVHCGFPIAKVELPSDNSASPPTNIKSDFTTTSSEQKTTEIEFEPKADSSSITQSNNDALWASGSVLKNSQLKFWIIGIFVIICLISTVQDSNTNPESNTSVSIISASEACGYLSSINLSTRGWKNFIDDMYSCSSDYKNIGRGIPLPNNIAYYVDGNRSKAQQFKLVININNRASSVAAHKVMLEAANILSKKVTGNELSEKLINAITQGTSYTQKLGQLTAKIIRVDWITGKGYEVKFIIE
jgi:hypothetical protein